MRTQATVGSEHLGAEHAYESIAPVYDDYPQVERTRLGFSYVPGPREPLPPIVMPQPASTMPAKAPRAPVRRTSRRRSGLGASGEAVEAEVDGRDMAASGSKDMPLS